MFLDSESTLLFDKYSHLNDCDWQLQENQSYLTKLEKALEALPLIIKIDDTLILHAGLPNVDSLAEIESYPEKYLDTILWSRSDLLMNIHIPGIKRVYCGHNFVPEPIEYNGFINIDTGAFRRYWKSTGKLTVVEVKK
jgi:hypothetical protein